MPTALVFRVRHGDTLELQDGENIKLEGVKVPPIGDLRYRKARTDLETLLITKKYERKKGGTLGGGGATEFAEVRYEGEARDEQGSLICQAWLGDTNLNEAMKEKGWR